MKLKEYRKYNSECLSVINCITDNKRTKRCVKDCGVANICKKIYGCYMKRTKTLKLEDAIILFQTIKEG